MRGLGRALIGLAALQAALAIAIAGVDVNRATEAELDGVKGLGPGTTRLILAERAKGEFSSWADLSARVKGIGKSRAARLSAEGLRVDGQPFVQAATAPR